MTPPSPSATSAEISLSQGATRFEDPPPWAPHRRPKTHPPGSAGLPPVGPDHPRLLDHVVVDRVEQLGPGQPGAGGELGIERVEPQVVVVASVALGRHRAVVALVAEVVR